MLCQDWNTTPTFDDIRQFVLTEPILHKCYTFWRQGDITLEQFYRMAIVAYIEENQALRDKLLLLLQSDRSCHPILFAHEG